MHFKCGNWAGQSPYSQGTIPNSRFTNFASFTLSIGLSKKSTTLKCIASITSGASASPDMMMIGNAARVDSRT